MEKNKLIEELKKLPESITDVYLFHDTSMQDEYETKDIIEVSIIESIDKDFGVIKF